MKLSVIVPAYKVEPYLPACLEGLARSDADGEFLIVNDGSPDRCGEIARSFAARDSRFLPLDKENGGLSDARNFGLDRASGDAVFFLDGDDVPEPGALTDMARAMEETGADLVLGDARLFWENGKEKTVSSGARGSVTGAALKPLVTRLYPAAWNKLYRRDLLERARVRFLPGVWFEDVAFFHCIFPFAKGLYALDRAAVGYRQRAGSITSRPDPKLFDYLTVVDAFCAFYRERDLLPAWEDEAAFCAARYLLATFCKRASKLPGDLPREAAARSLSFLDGAFPGWRKDPYFTGLKGWYLKHFSARFLPILRSIP
ncbi:MAG: glycosyltransferase family 2 protein [Clostridia bacterium]|nr:glycosyltransferase family 2 protein [Clostridia bacterium]